MSVTKPNIQYFQYHINHINKCIKNGYNLVGIDPGQQNLLSFKGKNKVQMKYTMAQYKVESGLKRKQNKLCEYENKLQLNIMTDEDYLKYNNLNHTISMNIKRSYKKLIENLKKTFGPKIILCVGDSGYNDINKLIIENISKNLKCYLVDESYTSKICCNCGSDMHYVVCNNITINRVIQCNNFKCRSIFNKDSNACSNILAKVYDSCGIAVHHTHEYMVKNILLDNPGIS